MTRIKERANVKSVLSVIIVVLVIFLLGAFSSLFERGGRSWVPVAMDKIKVVLGLNKPKVVKGGLSISTARYEFETVVQSTHPGTYQITTVDAKNVIAIERNTGLLLSLTPEGKSYKETVLSESVFPKDLKDSIKGRKLDNSTPPLVMDLHFGMNKLLYSVVIQEKEKACQYLALYEVSLGSPVNKELAEPILHFQTPCVKDTQNTAMWAGRIANNDSQIFLSVGEQRYDRSGYPKSNLFSKEDLVIGNTVFGKILTFNPFSFEHSVYSMGHRNAQGLFWDKEKYELLSAEHGPNGGDEVNVIYQGGNYGWPFASFGKPYPTLYPSGLPEVNGSKNPSTGVDLIPARKGYLSGTHEGYAFPLMSWSPGVGIGNVLRVASDSPLKDWRGDILAATMGERHLHRLRLHNGAVVFDENIDVGVRIRDILLLSNGNVAVSLDTAPVFILKVSDI